MSKHNDTRIRELEEENHFLRGHASKLDENWARLHNAGMDAIRQALGMPGASVAEMCETIRKLREIEGRRESW